MSANRVQSNIVSTGFRFAPERRIAFDHLRKMAAIIFAEMNFLLRAAVIGNSGQLDLVAGRQASVSHSKKTRRSFINV